MPGVSSLVSRPRAARRRGQGVEMEEIAVGPQALIFHERGEPDRDRGARAVGGDRLDAAAGGRSLSCAVALHPATAAAGIVSGRNTRQILTRRRLKCGSKNTLVRMID